MLAYVEIHKEISKDHMHGTRRGGTRLVFGYLRLVCATKVIKIMECALADLQSRKLLRQLFEAAALITRDRPRRKQRDPQYAGTNGCRYRTTPDPASHPCTSP